MLNKFLFNKKNYITLVLNMEEERVTPKKTLSGTSTDFSNPTPAMAQMVNGSVYINTEN